MNMCSYNCCNPKTKEFRQITSLSLLLKLVCEENRLRLLCLLNQGERCVCEIMEHVDFSQSLISHHLADLREADLIKDRKDGRRVFYALSTKGKKIVKNILSLKGETL